MIIEVIVLLLKKEIEKMCWVGCLVVKLLYYFEFFVKLGVIILELDEEVECWI